MSNKKHIDRIFQESFKDFEAKPNPELWSKIQSEMALGTEKPKKTLPIWLKIASVAAILAIFVTIGSFIFTESNNPDSSNKKTVDTKVQTDNKSSNSDKIDSIANDRSVNQNNSVVVNSQSASNNSSESNNNSLKNTEVDSTGNPIVSYNSEKNSDTILSNQQKATSSSGKNTKVANTNNNNYSNKLNTLNNTSNDLNNPNNNGINNGITSQENTSNSNKNEFVNHPKNTNNSNSNNQFINSVAIKTSDTPKNATESQVNKSSEISELETDLQTNKADALTTNTTANNLTNKTRQNTNTVALTINSENGSNKTASDIQRAVSTSETENLLKETSSQNAIAWNAKSSNTPQNEKEKEENLMVGDSLISESPSIEEAIAQAEETSEKEEDEKLVNRWQVQANIAPVYYNSLGKGSHIDNEFVSNSKSGETNTSYGVNVSYAISKKFAIRSGISSLNLSYDTDNVILYESPTTNTPNNTNPLRNINLAVENQELSAFSGDNLGFQQINNVLFNAAISQRLSYYEVPVELEYKLVNNRFGVHIIGGMSTFFLNDNEVYSEFEEYTTYIGEANNVNSVSFSTNLGIGLNYKFTEKLLFNFEPTFKYQLNGFENTSGNFRPYIIGVYTGFSYKF